VVNVSKSVEVVFDVVMALKIEASTGDAINSYNNYYEKRGEKVDY